MTKQHPQRNKQKDDLVLKLMQMGIPEDFLVKMSTWELMEFNKQITNRNK